MTTLSSNESRVQPARPKWLTYALYGAAGLVTLAFLASGGSKLAGAEMNVENFIRWGYPVWFMYVVGLIEVGGVALLLIPKSRFYGAAVLTINMLGAVFTHIAAGEAAMLPAPLMLGLLAGFIGWNYRPVGD